MTPRHRPRPSGALALGVAVWLAAHDASADEGLVRVHGNAPAEVTRRVRDELESLGHSVREDATVGETPPPVAEVRLETVPDGDLVARVRVGRRPEVTVRVAAAEREAAAVFALRVAEAVRAGLLAVESAPPPPTPVVRVTPPVVAVEREARWRVGVGMTAVFSPWSVGVAQPLAGPTVRVAWSGPLYAELRVAGLVLGGEVSALGGRLALLDVALGGGVAVPLGRVVRVGAGVRVHGVLLHATRAYGGNEYVRDELSGAVTGVFAVEAWLNGRVALRAELFNGALFLPVALGSERELVAEWRHELVGATASVEVAF